MTSTPSLSAHHSREGSWFSRATAWLDEKGKGAWIATLVVAFILFWPAGLALLAYMIWSKRMFTNSCTKHRHDIAFGRSSGNAAFDAYKADTLRRLQDEQEAFEAFLDRLRAAKDKAEFDQFLQDRAEARKTATDTQPVTP